MAQDRGKNWTIKDKITQFRGITQLQQRTFTHNKHITSHLRKKQGKEIKNLNVQNKKYRQAYGMSVHGDHKRLAPVLQSHPKIKLAFQNITPEKMDEDLKQRIFSKRKELDRLRHKKNQLQDVFLSLKLELEEVQSTSKPQESMWKEQDLLKQLEDVEVKQNGVSYIRDTNLKMLTILKKEMILFENVLENLKSDADRQCQCILKANKLGLEATQELIKLQKEYSVTENTVRKNMKNRDKVIRHMKAEVENVKEYLILLPKPEVKDEADRQAVKIAQEAMNAQDVDETAENKEETKDDSFVSVKKELEDLTEVLEELKEATLVQNYQDNYPRMMDLVRHGNRLQKQVDQNKEQKERLLDLHNSMDVILEAILYFTWTEETIKFQNHKNNLIDDISKEKKLLDTYKTDLNSKGEKILQVRTALITLNILLSKIFPMHGEFVISNLESEIAQSGSDTLLNILQPKLDVLTMLETVKDKLRKFMEEIEKEKLLGSPKIKIINKPRPIAVSKDTTEDEYDMVVAAMLDELSEIADPSVPTHRDIKEQSRKLVEQFEDPRAMFKGDTVPKYKKHACF